MIHAREDYQVIQDPRGLILEDEPVFLLEGSDRCFIIMLQLYLFLNSVANPNPGNIVLLKTLEKHINLAYKWQNEHADIVKFADLPGQDKISDIEITKVDCMGDNVVEDK